MKIAFQGENGAYSQAAIKMHFGPDTQTLPCETFDGIFAAVSSQTCDLGFLPIENSVAGSIHQNYDRLLNHALVVIGEHYLRVSHCLIGLPGSSLDSIRKVISHPQALAQCEQYLRGLKKVQVEPVYDTAGSVKMIRELGDPSVAAIASRNAADIYEMAILAEAIEDNEANITRFLILSREAAPPTPDSKTSIVFALDNKPGALFKALSVFALRDIDLSKIESRPLIGRPWEYLFYIDIAGGSHEIPVQKALANLEEHATFFRVLGSYPRHR